MTGDAGSAAHTHEAPLLLRCAGVGLLLDVSGPALPRIMHWGADPGHLDDQQLARLSGDLVPGVPNSAMDEPWPFTLVPTQAEGWSGHPGLACSRAGVAVNVRLSRSGPVSVDGDASTGQCVTCVAVDPVAALSVECELRLEPSGLLRARYSVTNHGDDPLTVDSLLVLLPVPATADEVVHLTGRWCRERSQQREPFHHGTRLRASRRGRPGHDSPLLLSAGTAGAGFRSGQVWAVHVAWSGDQVHMTERLPEGAGSGGAGVVGGGELLQPGEVVLGPGDTYQAPWVLATWSGHGFDEASARVHRWLRDRPGHPQRPRPLVLNSWEAVYFDHDLGRLTALAETAAQIGVERFVLDDGWFLGRRHDLAGLGDWSVDPVVWPDGLRPFADRVRELGMEFGLWVEPEMVSPDSEVARAHPDWVLAAPERAPRPWRHQLVLDVARPDVFAHLLDSLDSVVIESGAAFLKWDHNRDLHEAVHAGHPGVHAQTVAVYQLLDALRARHPGLEIESCASGGARVDLGILDRTDRVWASDTNDALERQSIQRWTGLLLPPELVGGHVGPPRAETTGRSASLAFRCLTSLFGHAGIEWDVTTCTDEELAELQAWAALYRELRGLLHNGDVVRADHADPGAWLHGVVAADRSQAVLAYVRLETSADALPGRLRVPGLQPDRTYEVVCRSELASIRGAHRAQPPWMQAGRTTATGAVLAEIGLPAPLLGPQEGVLIHLVG